jgi:hypothetical protein
MASYSGTPLAKKLGISEGKTVALLNAPAGLILEVPGGVDITHRARGCADVVVAFFTRSVDLKKRLGSLEKMIFPNGAIWAAWPKRASGMETDLTDNVVRELALARGLVDNKVCAIDETWSGLRVVWRVENRVR